MNLLQAVDEYIEHKRSLGIGFQGESLLLRAFVRAAGDIDMNRISPHTVRKFLAGKGPMTMYWFSKFHTLSPFYRFAIARHYVHRSPLPSVRPRKPEKFQPYIYSNQDIERLIDAADSCHRYGWFLEPHTIRTLLLLLYGTGLRISEALSLTIADFDLDGAVLTIRETKFHKTRLVPVGPDLHRVLRQYVAEQWAHRPHTVASPLLATRDGKPVLRQTAEIVFRRLRKQAGVARSVEARYQPRLHDFRHTFAVVRLVTWYREGKNVQRLLPHLSTYLGHLRIRDTQHYLTMTGELLNEAGLCFERYARPEVSHV